MEPMEDIHNDSQFSALMQAVQTGDRDAYVQLLHEITPRIRHIVRRGRPFLRAEDIEDLVQDVLLSVHVVRATYDPKRPFMPWLAAITRNRLVDAARRYVRSEAWEVQVDNLAVTFSDKSAKFTKDVYGDSEALRLVLDSLPAGQRNAIEMLKLREMSLKEASDASGTSVGALKIATHRAMSALRMKLMKKK